MTNSKELRGGLLQAVKRVPGILWGVLALICAFALVNPKFLSAQNIVNILTNSSVLLVTSCGMTLAILSGQLDLSVGGVATFAAMVVGLYMQPIQEPSVLQILAAIAIGMGIGAAFGAVNGLLIGFFRYNYWLVTFSTMSIGFGLAQAITNGTIISGYSARFLRLASSKFLGLPSLVWIALAVFLVLAFVLYCTRFGMHIYAVGDSEQCARQSGIRVKWIRFAIFVISGCLAGFAGVLLVARNNTATSILGNGYEFDAIAAVIIGGTPFVGGRGGLHGTIVGVISLYAIKTGLQLAGFNVYTQQVFIGLFILCIIVVDVISQNRKAKTEGRRVYK